MATPVLEGFTSDTYAGSGGSAEVTLTKPSGVASGDLLLLIFGFEHTGQDRIDAVSGFTRLAFSGDATDRAGTTVFWRTADGTEGASVTATASVSALTEIAAHYLRISGWDAIAGNIGTSGVDNGSTTSHAFNALTTTTADPLLLSIATFDGCDSDPEWTAASNSFVIQGEAQTKTSSFDGVSTAFATKTGGATGSYGVTWTSADSDGSSGFIIEISAGAGGGDALLADNIESDTTGSVPALGQAHSLLSDGLSAQSEVSQPAIGQAHTLAADGLSGTSSVSAPSLAEIHALSAVSVEAGSELSAPAIGQTHDLTASGLEAQAEIAAPAFGQGHDLAPVSIEGASSIGAPALTQVLPGNLLARDIEAQAEVSAPALGQVHIITADGVEAGTEVSAAAIGQAHALAAGSIEAQGEASAPSLAEDGAQAPQAANIESQTEISSPRLRTENMEEETGVDHRFHTPGEDGRYPDTENDWRFPSPGVDRRFPSPGVDIRFSGETAWGEAA